MRSATTVQFCDGSETCDAPTTARPGTPVDVDDGVGCTDDSCDEANDVVVNAPNDGLCDNGAFCDGSETCDAVNDCQAGTPPVMSDDGVGCTDDSCARPINDVVVNAPNDGLCDNGQFCDGSETCDAVNDCQEPARLRVIRRPRPATRTGARLRSRSAASRMRNATTVQFCDGAETCNVGTGECVAGHAGGCGRRRGLHG